MKNSIYLKGILVVVLGLFVYKNNAWPDQKTASKVILEEIVVHGKSLENSFVNVSADREVLVCLPPDYYDSDEEYPVVYLLHGLGANARAWFSDSPDGANVKKALEKLYASEQIEDMIVVVPDTLTFFLAGWYTNSAATGNWEDFIVRDLVEYVDKNYRTDKRREARGITGHSMGGYGAFKIGMKHADKFGAIYAMSAALSATLCLDEEVQYLAEINAALAKPISEYGWFEGVWISRALSFVPSEVAPLYIQYPLTVTEFNIMKKQTLIELLKANKNNLEEYDTEIGMEIGRYEYPTFLADFRLLSAELKKEGIEHFYEEYEGEHYDKLYLRVQNNLFQFFSRYFDE
jgi:enterochelin esterase-like enzyme